MDDISPSLANLANIGVASGCIEDAESITDILKIQNGRFTQNWLYFNSHQTDFVGLNYPKNTPILSKSAEQMLKNNKIPIVKSYIVHL